MPLKSSSSDLAREEVGRVEHGAGKGLQDDRLLPRLPLDKIPRLGRPLERGPGAPGSSRPGSAPGSPRAWGPASRARSRPPARPRRRGRQAGASRAPRGPPGPWQPRRPRRRRRRARRGAAQRTWPAGSSGRRPPRRPSPRAARIAGCRARSQRVRGLEGGRKEGLLDEAQRQAGVRGEHLDREPERVVAGVRAERAADLLDPPGDLGGAPPMRVSLVRSVARRAELPRRPGRLAERPAVGEERACAGLAGAGPAGTRSVHRFQGVICSKSGLPSAARGVALGAAARGSGSSATEVMRPGTRYSPAALARSAAETRPRRSKYVRLKSRSPTTTSAIPSRDAWPLIVLRVLISLTTD